MEVIRDTVSFKESHPVPKDFTPGIVSEMERQFRELEESRRRTFEEMKQRPPESFAPRPPMNEGEETITKRNAASVLIIELNKKKLVILVSAGVGIVTIGGFALLGIYGGFVPFAIYVIYLGNLFLSNEKEMKTYKERFGI